MILNEKSLLGTFRVRLVCSSLVLSFFSLCLLLFLSSLFLFPTNIYAGIHHYDNGSLINKLSSHPTEITVLLYIPHKHALLSISYDGRARMHDTHAASSVVMPTASLADRAEVSSQIPRTQSTHEKRAGPQSTHEQHVTTQSESRERTVLKATQFASEVCCATYSSVLGLIACVSKDSVIRIWDPDRYVYLLIVAR